jgi:hypothetical protein
MYYYSLIGSEEKLERYHPPPLHKETLQYMLTHTCATYVSQQVPGILCKSFLNQLVTAKYYL